MGNKSSSGSSSAGKGEKDARIASLEGHQLWEEILKNRLNRWHASAVLRKRSASSSPEVQKSIAAALNRLEQQAFAIAQRLWEEYDKDKNGTLDQTEAFALTQAVLTETRKFLSEDRLTMIVEIANIDAKDEGKNSGKTPLQPFDVSNETKDQSSDGKDESLLDSVASSLTSIKNSIKSSTNSSSSSSKIPQPPPPRQISSSSTTASTSSNDPTNPDNTNADENKTTASITHAVHARLDKMQKYILVTTSIILDILDVDSDGTITKEEFLTNYEKAFKLVFNPSQLLDSADHSSPGSISSSTTSTTPKNINSAGSNNATASGNSGQNNNDSKSSIDEKTTTSKGDDQFDGATKEHVTLPFKIPNVHKEENQELRQQIKALTLAHEKFKQTAAMEAEEKVICVVCLDAKKNICVHPCKHVCCCEPCANALEHCPMCRVPITKREKVFI